MSATLTRDEAGRWCVAGDMDMTTAADLLADSAAWFDAGAGGEGIEVDLGGVGRVDSAGLALVVHWAREARGKGTRLALHAVPAELTKLAAVSNLDSTLLGPLTA